MEAGALLPTFLPTSGPSNTLSRKCDAHRPCRRRGFVMAGVAVPPGPLVLACGEGPSLPLSVRCNLPPQGHPEVLAGALLPESPVCFDGPQL